MKWTLPSSVAFTAVSGGVVFCALLPWGDPCTAKGSSSQLCPLVLSTSRQEFANLVFVAICLFAGFVGGSISRRWVVGTLGVPFAALLGGISGHFLYAVKTPWFDSKVPAAYWMAALFIGAIAILGTVGAVAAQWTVWRRRTNA